MTEEKQEAVAEQRGWRRAALALLVLLVFCWSATIYGLAPEGSDLWNPVAKLSPFGMDVVRDRDTGETFEGEVAPFSEVRDGADVAMVAVRLASGGQKMFVRSAVDVELRLVKVRPMLFVAAAFFLMGCVFAVRRLRSRLAFVKTGQGAAVRISAYGMIFALAVFGAYTLHFSPGAESFWRKAWASVSALGRTIEFRWVLFPSVGVVLLILLITHLLLNRAGWTTFLIETEGELKKVSWPARKDYLGSSVVVLIVTVTMAMFLYAVDRVLSELLPVLGGF